MNPVKFFRITYSSGKYGKVTKYVNEHELRDFEGKKYTIDNISKITEREYNDHHFPNREKIEKAINET